MAPAATAPLGPRAPGDPNATGPGPRSVRDPSREYLVGGPVAGFSPAGGYLTAQAIDDVVKQFGPWVYELMRLDPAVSGSLFLLYAGILAEGPKVVSAITLDPGVQARSRRRRRDLRLAGQIAEFWQRQVDGLTPDFDQVLWDLLDEACTGGCSLAEPVYTPEPIDTGPDKGKLGLMRLTVKPRWSWGLRVDPYMRVRRIRGWTTGGWIDIDREHFVLLSWQPRSGDPRGTRVLRPAYPAWNVKLQAIPDYAEYLKHHADPKLILTAGQYAESDEYTDPATGARATRSPQERLLAAAQQFGARSILALGYGDAAQYLYSQGNGEAYLKGFDWCDREVFRSIILGTRPMQEAKHGSKADTDSGEDLIGMAVTQSRKPLRGAVCRDLFYRGTLLNWGKEVADRYTPLLTFGVSDHLSPDLMRAMATAWSTGVFDLPQRPWMLAKLGAPLDPDPDPEAADGNPPAGGTRRPPKAKAKPAPAPAPDDAGALAAKPPRKTG